MQGWWNRSVRSLQPCLSKPCTASQEITMLQVEAALRSEEHARGAGSADGVWDQAS